MNEEKEITKVNDDFFKNATSLKERWNADGCRLVDSVSISEKNIQKIDNDLFENASSIEERWADEGGTMLHSLSYVPKNSKEYKEYFKK